ESPSPAPAAALADADGVGDSDGGGASDGGGVDCSGLGLKSSSTGRGCVLGRGSGSKGTQPTPVKSTSGQANASAPRISVAPGRTWNPTTTRVGRPIIRPSTANEAANCSEVPRWPPPLRGPNRK